MSAIIPIATVQSITGAADGETATLQGNAVVGLIEAYLGITLIKQTFTDEKITVPYKYTKIFKTKHGPINSVSEFSLITSDATYNVSNKYLALGYKRVEVSGKIPAYISAVKLTYNAGYYDNWDSVPALLKEAAYELLKYKYAAGYQAGYTSEHLGDYSYTKGSFIKGLPVEIAGMLDGVEL